MMPRDGMSGVRVGVDVGGTFTDFVAWDMERGLMTSLKVPTTPAEPAAGVLSGLSMIARQFGEPRTLAHGTTIVTNAIVERRGATIGLVTTRGFRDVLEIGRMSRRHLYKLDVPPKPEPLVPRQLRFEITERVTFEGNVAVPLAIDEIPPLIEALRSASVEAVAICLLHSYANPLHERMLRDALLPHFSAVTISSDVNPEFREFERMCTTILNASVTPLVVRYLNDLSRSLIAHFGELKVHLLQSNGGMMSVGAASERPLAMAVSGPAAGVAAASSLARRLRLPRALAFDMGGTTTDVCLIVDGAAESSAQRRLGDYPVRLPMVAVESIGAGGGSIAWVDNVGALKVGPRSAGAAPGPACYGQGGSEATVTDANLVLGYLNSERVYGGAIRLDAAASLIAMRSLAVHLGLSPLQIAHGVVEVANANMERALRLVSVQRGYDLREFTLIAYGGAGPIHVGRLAGDLGIPHVIVPNHSGAFSALGCLVSDLRYDAVKTFRISLADWDVKRVGEQFEELVERCSEPLFDEGYTQDAIGIIKSVDLRYNGQNYEISVPLEEHPIVLREAFEARHRQLYGYATGERVDCVNLRVAAVLQRESSNLPVNKRVSTQQVLGKAKAFFPETGLIEILRYDRDALAETDLVQGPAIVENASSTVVVYPGQRCRMDSWGNLHLELVR